MSSQDIIDNAKAILDAVETDRKCEVVLYNGPINEDGFGALVQAASGIGHNKKIFLVLVTFGGQADAAYRIARYCQKNFRGFELFVPKMCKSAGTLVAFGAKKIFMSPFGELGPLDVQLYKEDELFVRRSGLIGKSAIRTLTE